MIALHFSLQQQGPAVSLVEVLQSHAQVVQPKEAMPRLELELEVESPVMQVAKASASQVLALEASASQVLALEAKASPEQAA